MPRSSFGSIEALPSGRYRARYAVPGTKPVVWVKAPSTFTTKRGAQGWLAKQRVDLEEQRTRPEVAAVRKTLAEYADEWLATRRSKTGGPLRPTTKRAYQSHLDTHILPVLGSMALPSITPEVVRAWYAGVSDDVPTSKARTYALLRTIMASAVQDGYAQTNPVVIRGAANVKPKKKVQVATPAQVDALAAALPVHLSLAVLLGAWCAVRAGEVLELRRKDVAPDGAWLRVERAVSWADGRKHIGPPKTDAGERTITVPPHVRPALIEHLATWVAQGPEALLFPSVPGSREHTTLSMLDHRVKDAVRGTEGVPGGLTFHHLRHTGLTFAARAGATVAELMSRAGHSTPGMAMRYQHAASERDEALAQAMSQML